MYQSQLQDQFMFRQTTTEEMRREIGLQSMNTRHHSFRDTIQCKTQDTRTILVININ